MVLAAQTTGYLMLLALMLKTLLKTMEKIQLNTMGHDQDSPQRKDTMDDSTMAHDTILCPQEVFL